MVRTYKFKAKEAQEKTKLIAVRLELSYCKALDSLALADPERTTVSTLVRRAIREYLQRQGKLPRREVMKIETAARLWLDNLRNRKRSPAKQSTLAVFTTYVNAHILPAIGSSEVAEFGNRQMKDFVSQHLPRKISVPNTFRKSQAP